MILSAQTIRSLCEGPLLELSYRSPMIDPFCERTRFNGVSYGLSAAGYDVRIDSGRIIHGLAFVLASTLEHFDMPDDVLGIVHDKSTWVRRGLSVFNTVIEPGWRGFLTLELVNHGGSVLTIPHGTGIAQVVFHRLDVPSLHPYEGKYQDQRRGPQPALDDPDD